MLSNLTILILFHFVSDFFFQPGKWGENKIKHFKPRFFHAIQYSIVFLPVLYFLRLNMLWVLWIFVTHLLIDSYKFVNWWNIRIRKTTKEVPGWFLVVQDQILHILVLLPIVILL